jgi:hypothetical protein
MKQTSTVIDYIMWVKGMNMVEAPQFDVDPGLELELELTAGCLQPHQQPHLSSQTPATDT